MRIQINAQQPYLEAQSPYEWSARLQYSNDQYDPSRVNVVSSEVFQAPANNVNAIGDQRDVEQIEEVEQNEAQNESPVDPSGQYMLLAQGAVKDVWVKRGDHKHVYYTPKRDSNLDEIYDEVDARTQIHSKLIYYGQGEMSEALIDAPVLLPQGEWINNKPTFKIKKKDCDLDQVLRGKLNNEYKTVQVDTPAALKVIGGIFGGVAAYHSVNWIHGDLKPDNFLYSWENHSVQLSDPGKAKELEDRNDVRLHAGNPRMGLSPEGVGSLPGEVWSCGVMAVYVLEQQLLNEDRIEFTKKRVGQQRTFLGEKLEEIARKRPRNADKLTSKYKELLGQLDCYAGEIEDGNYRNSHQLERKIAEIEKLKSKKERVPLPQRNFDGDMMISNGINLSRARKSKRVGIERFLVFNPRCLQGESSGLRNIRVRIRTAFAYAMVKLTGKGQKEPASVNAADVPVPNPVHEYIEKLFVELNKQPDADQYQLGALRDLLVRMTSDPESRPAMEDVFEFYQAIYKGRLDKANNDV